MSAGINNRTPCGHPGCLNHVTHPCEGCGRIAGMPAVDNTAEAFARVVSGPQPVESEPADSRPADFESWLRTACFQKPTKEAYDLAKSAWNQASAPQPVKSEPATCGCVNEANECDERSGCRVAKRLTTASQPAESRQVDFESWLRAACFQKPTKEAYDLAKSAWNQASALQPVESEPVAYAQDLDGEMSPEFAFSWARTKLHDQPLYATPQPCPKCAYLKGNLIELADRYECNTAIMKARTTKMNELQAKVAELEKSLLDATYMYETLSDTLTRTEAVIEHCDCVLTCCREYPDFDSGGPLVELITQALAAITEYRAGVK